MPRLLVTSNWIDKSERIRPCWNHEALLPRLARVCSTSTGHQSVQPGVPARLSSPRNDLKDGGRNQLAAGSCLALSYLPSSTQSLRDAASPSTSSGLTSPHISATPHLDLLTDDRIDVLRLAADAAAAAGVQAAHATLIDIRCGAARSLSAQMGGRADCHHCGFLSGDCTEAAVAAGAFDAIAAGKGQQVSFGLGDPFSDIVLPCGGGITLAIHVLRSPQVLLSAPAALAERRLAGPHHIPGTGTLLDVPRGIATGWTDIGFEVGYRPRTRLLIYGHSIELHATARLADTRCMPAKSAMRTRRPRSSTPLRWQRGYPMNWIGSFPPCRPRWPPRLSASAHWAVAGRISGGWKNGFVLTSTIEISCGSRHRSSSFPRSVMPSR
ncbi:xanthine and CO dehydrogenases maturation factor, XdhC/CoxF family [Frateuria aurantia DSM 6220]|uniref:Xanthine and CO dehydrogenases maturation factor, XdhC/CoxF family n=1 Tax=Frateuria aurantia (strain ATCC 33424 / DSM 6220 / KCTC 2777 / LMG 1558 / NBRC 3245 / NCIMB 13370) TaxID=767434 RepID=H8L4J9_FRAAD|nr:xanthine and CO dehydrogenases maturation factor, XdhC/CoxF family [Frateuria aurantia DSM 6220]